MEIDLDANATTPVLPAARAAAIAAMAADYGNPSSSHSTGLRARALLDGVRERARRVLGLPDGGHLLLTSGATEGIQTAVLSALTSLRGRADVDCVLYGATEHKAVPEALRHWVRVLQLNMTVRAIPVGPDGRHDLTWLRAHAPRAGLVCTMAANNETGVISDLPGIAQALAGSPALWLVDSVQALGKLRLDLAGLPIDYAPFSGHKLYAPKGIGLLHVRQGAPFTPLLCGGGQEAGLRAGTENMPGAAALGAVLRALEAGDVFQPAAVLERWRRQLADALTQAFPGLLFNTPPKHSLPTTLNFSVPGVSVRVLLDLFDAADVRVSAGSACSAARAEPSHVLLAMGLPEWRAASAVRLSFGPAMDPALIDVACERIAACGAALQAAQWAGDVPRSKQEAVAHVAQTASVLGDVAATAACQISADALRQLLQAQPHTRVVDVRDTAEQRLKPAAAFLPHASSHTSLPLASLLAEPPAWLMDSPDAPLVFLCRSGKRSDQAALALRALGHRQAWSLHGGLALWAEAAMV
ncbi:aminotransferase class V-fold PLP-dependent enzyme [Ideonella sp.]|uniref:aminotransferase class V-fold PLP-dependent enzyme n=1 Tax=Ideonella sp. TaxID=1929293 RepID=UPI003BB4AE85